MKELMAAPDPILCPVYTYFTQLRSSGTSVVEPGDDWGGMPSPVKNSHKPPLLPDSATACKKVDYQLKAAKVIDQ